MKPFTLFALAATIALSAPTVQAEHREPQVAQVATTNHQQHHLKGDVLTLQATNTAPDIAIDAMSDCPGCDQSYRVNNTVADCPGCDQSYAIRRFVLGGALLLALTLAVRYRHRFTNRTTPTH